MELEWGQHKLFSLSFLRLLPCGLIYNNLKFLTHFLMNKWEYFRLWKFWSNIWRDIQNLADLSKCCIFDASSPRARASLPLVTPLECVSQGREWGNIPKTVICLFETASRSEVGDSISYVNKLVEKCCIGFSASCWLDVRSPKCEVGWGTLCWGSPRVAPALGGRGPARIWVVIE